MRESTSAGGFSSASTTSVFVYGGRREKGMGPVDAAARVQRYMITSRQVNGTSLPVGPFVVRLHASDDDVQCNVAMPGVPEIGALASYMVQTALEHGCDLVFLRTTSPAARRAYERAGFQPLGSVLPYTEGASDGQ